ncbi:MAG: hypothetical protein KGJ24_11165 [Burkholderiales bacterium]|nr:hypothetical protein [Burkholderiales bacterium]
MPAATAALPARNLTVQWRVVDARALPGDPTPFGGRSVSTQDLAPPETLTLTVLNGRWARLRVARSIPVQWVRAAAQDGPAAGGNGSPGGAAVVNEITWIDAGQGLAVRVRWPGRGAAEVDLDAQAAKPQPAAQAPLPATRREQAATTLAVPIGAWVTVATVGASPARAEPPAGGRHWGTEAAGAGPRLMQLRLSLP